MKNSKKGISLIVLIITIIVIIILATAILVSVINNNPISEANKARYESDRDNMQAVFTNTVGKIMAENQGVVNVTAGQINTETTGVKETTGEVVYTVDNATVAANASGTIKFDKGTNDATTYYTGKKLPIYAAGETKWYVDSEGVLILEVAGVKYGSGDNGGSELTYTSLGNYQHQTSDGTVEEHDTESGTCSKCGETVLAPGLYKTDGTFVSWEQLTSAEHQSFTYIGEDYEEITTGALCVDENGVLTAAIDYDMMSYPSADYLNGKLVIDSSVKSIGSYAFGFEGSVSCSNLTSIVIPNAITSIGAGAFNECKSLTSIIIPNSITEIRESVFLKSGLKSITIPNSVTSIGGCAFFGCEGLTSITIPDSVTSIGSQSFENCTSLSLVDLGKGVTEINGSAFSGCTSLTSIIIPDNVTSIRDNAFRSCISLTSVTIPDSVTNIHSYAFYKCSSLISIYIPSSVETIKSSTVVSSPFSGCSSDLRIYCGASKVQSGWSEYWNYYDSTDTLDVTYGVTRAEYETIISQ